MLGPGVQPGTKVAAINFELNSRDFSLALTTITLTLPITEGGTGVLLLISGVIDDNIDMDDKECFGDFIGGSATATGQGYDLL